MQRDVLFYGAFLVASLGAAYWAALPSDSGDQGSVALVRLEPGALQSLTWTDAEREVQVTPKDAEGPEHGYWVVVRDQSTDATERFVASSSAETLLEALRPLRALRVLEAEPSPERLAEFGLADDGEATLALEFKDSGRRWRLRLGAKSFGSRNRYAFDPAAKQLVLMRARVFEPLEKPRARLFQQRVLAGEVRDADRITLFRGDRQRVAEARRRDQGGWVLDTGDPADDDREAPAPNPALANWIDKVGRLKAERYALAERVAELSSLSPLFGMAYFEGDELVDELELRETDGVFWVRTRSTGSFAEVSGDRGETLHRDLRSLLEP